MILLQETIIGIADKVSQRYENILLNGALTRTEARYAMILLREALIKSRATYYKDM